MDGLNINTWVVLLGLKLKNPIHGIQHKSAILGEVRLLSAKRSWSHILPMKKYFFH